jgi:3-oxoacyl-[acyl-carrier protein] reductase
MTNSEGRLAGKVALITGAARGLGAAMARRFAEAGATPIVTDLSEAACREVAEPLGGDAFALDVTDSAAVNEVFAKVAANHGRLDILVNNAGISGMEQRPDEVQRTFDIGAAQMAESMAGQPITHHLDVTERTTDDDWHRVLAVHLDGTFFCTRAAIPLMGPARSWGRAAARASPPTARRRPRSWV